MTTRVLPRFWHGEDMATWLLLTPMTLGRLMELEQAVFLWSRTVGKRQP